MDVFNEFIMVKMKFEVTMVVYGERLWAFANIYKIKYLNIESSKFKTVQGVHKSLIR